MNLLLLDTPERKRLYPLTLTRATADLRIGIDTLRQKWERLTGLSSSILTDHFLQEHYGTVPAGVFLIVDASLLPTTGLVRQLEQLNLGEAFADDHGLVAGKIALDAMPEFGKDLLPLFSSVQIIQGAKRICMPCNLFAWNDEMIRQDFKHYSQAFNSNNLHDGLQMVQPQNIFIEEGATVSHSIINASTGPVYIGKNAHVMEGCLIRGPFALGEGAVLKMGTKIYGATTIGPYCVGGGEIKNSIMMAYSNKAHDGYLGDSIIGDWCNLGAGTSNSNLKNNVGEIKVWSYYENSFIPAGIKCGIVMGDYSRSSINTAFNTGTVVGVCCNVFGEGLSPKFIPDFTWGSKGLSRYEFDKGLKDVMNWMRLKNIYLDDGRIKILKYIFDHYNEK